MSARTAVLRRSARDLRGELWTLAGAVFTVSGTIVGIIIGTSSKHHGWLGSVVLVVALSVGIPLIWFLIRSGFASYQLKELSIVDSSADLERELRRIVDNAKKILVTTGSRSQNKGYLDQIEARLRAEPKLVYYRILFGNPRHQVLKDHIKQLLAIRDPDDRSLGYKTLYISLIGSTQTEWFVVANESRALVIIPSLNTVGTLDSAVTFANKSQADSFIQYVKQLYPAGTRIEDTASAEALTVG